MMLLMEPLLHCLDDGLFSLTCANEDGLIIAYSFFSALALLFYFLMLIDLAVFSTRISAFALVCGRVLSEVVLFLGGMAFAAVAFSSAVSTLDHDIPNFDGIPRACLEFIKVTLGMFGGRQYDKLNESPALFIAVSCYVLTTVVFLGNLLIAQLSCAYQTTYQDMLGFARLNRGKIVTETVPLVRHKRWLAFVA